MAANAVCTFISAMLVVLAPAESGGLSQKDQEYLESAARDFLFDPNDAKRVRVSTLMRTVWGEALTVETDVWEKQADGKRRFFATDGAEVIPIANTDVTEVDFIAQCRARYEVPEAQDDENDTAAVLDRMRQNAVGRLTDAHVANAAWLHRLGQDRLAAVALKSARDAMGGRDADPVNELRDALAWSAFAGLVHAYMVRADEEALAHGQRLIRLYAAEATDYPQAEAIIDELKRRKAEGTFNKPAPDSLPNAFETWSVDRRAEYWIAQLDQVDARQWGQPGGVNMSEDPRVQELVKLGEPIVPRLIDVIERDKRLTRSVHFWRDFSRNRTVLGVREAALTALSRILRVRVFTPVATGDNFTLRDEAAIVQTVETLRNYWAKYGKMPFDARMMNILTDPQTTFAAKREAARNLAELARSSDAAGAAAAAVIEKFDNPSVATAILAAMDAEISADIKAENPDPGRIESFYAELLVRLGDRRIEDQVVRRGKSARDASARLLWSFAAHMLGDSTLIDAFADDFARGEIDVPVSENRSSRRGDLLDDIVGSLVAARTDACDRAMHALVEPSHPAYARAAAKVMRGWPNDQWLRHPSCLRVLRHAFDDSTETGRTLEIAGEFVSVSSQNSSGAHSIPEIIADPRNRVARATEHAFDVAAQRLGEHVMGCPPYHPLMKDAAARLKEIEAAVDRFKEYETLPKNVAAEIGEWNETLFVPRLVTGRVATADDVRQGRAVFCLDGKATPAMPEQPMLVRLHADAADARLWLVIQAETDADGQTTYGLISTDAVKTVNDQQIARRLTLAEAAKERAARTTAPQGSESADN